MEFRNLVSNLESAFGRGLPGVAGQIPMAPRPRRGWEPDRFPDDARTGGVLILLFPGQLPDVGGAALFLTVRSRDLPNHAGQVSLPGGAAEPGESAEQAALRETAEEIGVGPTGVTVLGALTPLHVPVSRFVLHPFVGVVDRYPCPVADEAEVVRVIELPVCRLMDPLRVGRERRTRGAGGTEVPYFLVDGEKVWGATAMVLSEFLALIGQPPDPWR